MHRSMMILMVATACLALVACGGESRSAYSQAEPPQRDIALAEERFAEAMAEVASEDPEAAEAALLAVLDADLYHGPAHNNLGVLYLEQGRLYEAANEFEWARKLMPGHPDPRVNLAVVLAEAGRSLDAVAEARAAIDVRPGYMPALQTIALIEVRERRADQETLVYLREIALRGEDATWREWARRWSDKLADRPLPKAHGPH